MRRMPFKGIGKPEPLKGDRCGCWSVMKAMHRPQRSPSCAIAPKACAPARRGRI
ncbi:type II toxin-antitoxin system YoeB family toxin [Psychromarinibacter sp. S121]|uniref:type II toxin-antitoxin system YoeB family toxin n=1 Tax=Psychromarinibacter sp. S121 TaxID=3415127 RepID=UPI003C7E2632